MFTELPMTIITTLCIGNMRHLNIQKLHQSSWFFLAVPTRAQFLVLWFSSQNSKISLNTGNRNRFHRVK